MIFFKKCPCCKHTIFVWNSKPCKCIENYKCYYCPKCKNQITSATAVKQYNHTLGIAVSAVTIVIVKLLNFDIKDDFLFVVSILSISLLYAIAKGTFVRLVCIDDDCIDEIHRDNSDLWGSDVPWMKMDSIEKENQHHLINFATGLNGYGLLIIIFIGVIVSLIKYLFD